MSMANALYLELKFAQRMAILVNASPTIKAKPVRYVTMGFLDKIVKVNQSCDSVCKDVPELLDQWLKFLSWLLECDCKKSGTTDLICGKSNGKCLCKHNVDGEKCERCKHGFYDHPKCEKSKSFIDFFCNYLTTFLKPFSECECYHQGSRSESCSNCGVCTCKHNYEGANCSTCADGYFGSSCERKFISSTYTYPFLTINPMSINFSNVFIACRCHVPGSESFRCNKTTGKCTCHSEYADTRTCDTGTHTCSLSVSYH